MTYPHFVRRDQPIRPGFYVSAIDGPRRKLIAGPFPEHDQALAEVDPARNAACDIDGALWFWAWGTCRVKSTEVDAISSL